MTAWSQLDISFVTSSLTIAKEVEASWMKQAGFGE
jgi:hypothetical protein